jgi:hypothetical protein
MLKTVIKKSYSILKPDLTRKSKKYLIHLKNKFYDQLKKYFFSKRMVAKNKELLSQIRGKKRLKVIFLAIHKSIWKVDPVFKKMLDDPYFEPIVLVCPYVQYGKERMLEDMEDAWKYFFEKGYPVQKSLKSDGSWVKLEEINPDIVFFTNPHNLTLSEYYDKAYKNYLSCYAGYGMPFSLYDNNQSQYNQFFHNSIWRIFVQNKLMYDDYLKYSFREERSLTIVIDNIVEDILSVNRKIKSTWKNSGTHKKVIFAPHHTIEKQSPPQLGNFLKYAELLKQLVLDTRETLTWSFKPHPILKSKLYINEQWGREKTDDYYNFWKNQHNSQLDEGEYIDLFRQSDAMILDSASFTAEYIFTKKPMLYLMNDNTRKSVSKFGNECLDMATEAWNEQDIKRFIDNLHLNKESKQDKKNIFINEYLKELGKNKTSTAVLEIIRSEIKKNEKNNTRYKTNE